MQKLTALASMRKKLLSEEWIHVVICLGRPCMPRWSHAMEPHFTNADIVANKLLIEESGGS